MCSRWPLDPGLLTPPPEAQGPNVKALSVACFGRTIAITHGHAQIRLCALVPRIDFKTIHVVKLRLRWRSDGEVCICGASIYIDGSCAALWQPLQRLKVGIRDPVYGCSQDRGTQRSRAIHVNTPSSTIVLCSRSPLYTRRKDPPPGSTPLDRGRSDCSSFCAHDRFHGTRPKRRGGFKIERKSRPLPAKRRAARAPTRPPRSDRRRRLPPPLPPSTIDKSVKI